MFATKAAVLVTLVRTGYFDEMAKKKTWEGKTQLSLNLGHVIVNSRLFTVLIVLLLQDVFLLKTPGGGGFGQTSMEVPKKKRKGTGVQFAQKGSIADYNRLQESA